MPLALGEPLGGGLFVSNVVLAIVILASPTGTVKVMKSAFLRDAGFYLGAVLLLLLFVYDGKVRVTSRLLLLLLTGYYATLLLLACFFKHDVPARVTAGMLITLLSREYIKKSPATVDYFLFILYMGAHAAA